MINYIKGDLLISDCDVICHGCNCFHTMGSGIARQIANRYPLVEFVDKKTKYGDREKLGTYSTANIQIGNDKNLIILNCYTQYNYGFQKVNCDYNAIEKVMIKINNEFPQDCKIGMPKIGCGLAGGYWNIVEEILNRVFADREIFVYTID
jgi:O-acetyl-ADP-ribose deacetylase (regulator of RNase III)